MEVRMKRLAILLAAAFVLGACAAQSDPTAQVSQQALADDGRDIAEAQCAACHSIGTYGESPMAQAPPFRTVLSRYREDVLKEELIEGIQVTHPMPEFQFNPQSVDALIAYLHSIQQPPQT
jgi:mono/diheme cytochrome c family protein